MPNPIRRGTQGTTLPLSNAPDAAVETNASSLNALTASIQSHDLEAVGRLLDGVVLDTQQANALLQTCCAEISANTTSCRDVPAKYYLGCPRGMDDKEVAQSFYRRRVKESESNSEDQALAATQRIHAVFKAVLAKAVADNAKDHIFPENWLAPEAQECVRQYGYSALLGEIFSAFDPHPGNPSTLALLKHKDRDLGTLIAQHLSPLERARFCSLTTRDLPGFYERITTMTLDGDVVSLKGDRLQQAVDSLAKMPNLSRLKLTNLSNSSAEVKCFFDAISDEISDEVSKRLIELEICGVSLRAVENFAQFSNLKKLTLRNMSLGARKLIRIIDTLGAETQKKMISLRISGMALAFKEKGKGKPYEMIQLQHFESLETLELSCTDGYPRSPWSCSDETEGNITDEIVMQRLLLQLPNRHLLKALNLAESPFNTVSLKDYLGLASLDLNADGDQVMKLSPNLVLATISPQARTSIQHLNLTAYGQFSADHSYGESESESDSDNDRFELSGPYPDDLSAYSVLKKLIITDPRCTGVAAALIETLPAETRKNCVIDFKNESNFTIE